MIVYRLAPTKLANDLTGTGARLFGGRWNHPGLPCLFASESRAHNFLLNPGGARKFKILQLADFHFDIRIKE